MPVNYGSYQIDPFQGFNQGLANIGRALQYRREMERQRMLDAENKRLRDLQIRQANLGIERTEAQNLGTIGAYSEEGKPRLTLGEAYAAQAKKEMQIKEADLLTKRTNIYLGFIKDLKTSKGTAVSKTAKLRTLLSKDPSPIIQEISKTVELEGDKVKYTRIYEENELKYPDGTFAPAGMYDVEVEETGDLKNPVRLIASKKREEKVKEYAPQLKKFVKGKEVRDVDMNKPEDVKKARAEGFTEYEKPEKPEKPEKLTMSDAHTIYNAKLAGIKARMNVDLTPNEQETIKGKDTKSVMELYLADQIGRSMSPEKKTQYKNEILDAENEFNELRIKVLEMKGVKLSEKIGIEGATISSRGKEIPPPVIKETELRPPLATKNLIKLSKEQTNQIIEIIKKEKARGVSGLTIMKYMKEEGIDTTPFIDLISE